MTRARARVCVCVCVCVCVLACYSLCVTLRSSAEYVQLTVCRRRRHHHHHRHQEEPASGQVRVYRTNTHCTVSKKVWIYKPGIERVQALADISRSALCCHSNQIRAPIANPPNSAQLEGTPIPFPPSYIRVRAVVRECGEGQTNTQTAVTNIHFASATPHTKCNSLCCGLQVSRRQTRLNVTTYGRRTTVRNRSVRSALQQVTLQRVNHVLRAICSTLLYFM